MWKIHESRFFVDGDGRHSAEDGAFSCQDPATGNVLLPGGPGTCEPQPCMASNNIFDHDNRNDKH